MRHHRVTGPVNAPRPFPPSVKVPSPPVPRSAHPPHRPLLALPPPPRPAPAPSHPAAPPSRPPLRSPGPGPYRGGGGCGPDGATARSSLPPSPQRPRSVNIRRGRALPAAPRRRPRTPPPPGEGGEGTAGRPRCCRGAAGLPLRWLTGGTPGREPSRTASPAATAPSGARRGAAALRAGPSRPPEGNGGPQRPGVERKPR